jgi:hypothetical protein
MRNRVHNGERQWREMLDADPLLSALVSDQSGDKELYSAMVSGYVLGFRQAFTLLNGRGKRNDNGLGRGRDS